MLKFWDVINCIFMHWTKKLTLVFIMPLFVKFKGRTVFLLAHPLFCWVKKEILWRLEFTNAIWCHKFIYRPINFSAGYEKIELCEPLKSLSIVTNQVLTKSILMAHKQITIGSKPFWSSLIFFVLFLISRDILSTFRLKSSQIWKCVLSAS